MLIDESKVVCDLLLIYLGAHDRGRQRKRQEQKKRQRITQERMFWSSSFFIVVMYMALSTD